MSVASPGYSKAQALRSGGKAAVRAALLETRQRTLALADAYAAALGPELRVDYCVTVNPPLWELGHVAWFQEYWLARNSERALGVHCDPSHPRSPSLLPQADSCYDSSRVEHRSRWALPLPGRRETRAYLAATLERTLALLDGLAEDAGDDALYFFRLVALHEAMHAEAATYMARGLGIELPGREIVAATEEACSALFIPAQAFRLGAEPGGFAFDNELGAHEVRLAGFEIDAQPVSWSRFLAFVDDGGCERKPEWDEAGAREPHAPAVHLTAFEAQAWCRWAGRRLPTEAEWECAALQASGFAWGRVWEWTASDFEPYPGFAPHPYRDYSAPWFGTRRVLRGACTATSPWLAHPRYRNFFEPQRSDIFAGFRSCA
jgi:EgtB-related family protein